jgi:hypothetical protein
MHWRGQIEKLPVRGSCVARNGGASTCFVFQFLFRMLPPGSYRSSFCGTRQSPGLFGPDYYKVIVVMASHSDCE